MKRTIFFGLLAAVLSAGIYLLVVDPILARNRSFRILDEIAAAKKAVRKDPLNRSANLELVAFLKSENGWTRKKALASLASLRGVFDLSDATRHEFEDVFVPILKERLFDERHVRREAALAIGANPRSSLSLVEDLAKALQKYSGEDTASFALYALAEMGPASYPFLPLMREEAVRYDWGKDALVKAVEKLEAEQMHNQVPEPTAASGRGSS